ncbi:hypothetical protein ACEWY4_002331 [Coilia grayii]|uniref:Glycosyltransferase 2-like domain-containing protein n=1 Tax=Coilia grayii TaxID=363190 RepID=A0ABD1KN16_9TELE
MLISPPNSPLQYPSHGFTVHPLKKTLVPGVSVYCRSFLDNTLFVSLHAFHGMLTVEKVAPGQDVHRQNQSSLSIVATNLTALNDLLAQVTYSSAVYLLKTEDLVHFTFEDHEAIFPVTIERPSIPVLYDLGADINSQVTIVTKTFLRYRELKVLIQTIRAKYPDIRIIIADDSLKTENVVGHNVDQYLMPPAKGWFAGRNLAISQVTTKYFLWVDDDFLFLNETNLEMFVEIMESVPKLDVLGGSVVGGRFYFTLEHEDGEPGGDGGCLSRQMNGHYGTLPGFQDCVLVDGVVNFFLGRTDAVRRVGFDPMLQRVAHSEFFMDGLGRLLVASCAGLVIGHQKPRSNTAYGKFRHPGKSDVVHKLRLHYFKNHLKCVTY